jgi:hypothetical protein
MEKMIFDEAAQLGPLLAQGTRKGVFMRNVQLTKAWCVWAWILIPALSACGGLRKLPWESETQKASTLPNNAEPFQLWVLPQGEAPDFPVEDTSKALNQDSLIHQEEIVFQDTFPVLPTKEKSRPLFLVWPENSFGSQIVDAHYEHQVKDPLNRTFGEPDRESASFDSKSQRWFIPFSRFFRGSASELNPADIHRVTLDLVLSDHSRKRLRVDFKLLGPIPQIPILALPLGLTGSAREWSAKAALPAGRSVWKEQLSNPTRRPLALWISLNGPSVLELKTQLQFPEYTVNNNRPPSGPFPRYFESLGHLRIGKLLVTGNRGTATTLYFNENKAELWQKVVFNPLETLTLEWVAVPPANAIRCPLPPTQTATFSWETRSFSHCHEGDCMGGDFNYHEQTLVQPWSVVSSRIEGEWSRELRVAETFLSSSDVLKDTDPQPLPVKTQFTIGEPARPAAPLGCQGIVIY